MKEFSHARLDGRIIRYICRGTGSPTVILEQGAGISVETGFARTTQIGWARVFAEVQKFTRIFMYDRAGLGKSTGALGPRSGRALASDLRGVLAQANIEPPYVLVGHSVGGFVARLFASEYPNDVAGMVLVDSSHPDQMARFSEALPAESSQEPAVLKALRRSPPMTTAEKIDYSALAEEVRRVRFDGNKPLIVLTRNAEATFRRDVPSELSSRLEQVWLELQKDLLSLSVDHEHRVAAVAGHNIQLDEPQFVVQAILDVVRSARLRQSSSIH